MSLEYELLSGEISMPVRSATGWHVLHISDETPRRSFTESVYEIKLMMKMEDRDLMLSYALIERDINHPVVPDLFEYYRDNQFIARCTSCR